MPTTTGAAGASPATTTISKPAGVALQLLGGLLAFWGVVMLVNGYGVGGLVVLGLGGWLLMLGRRPATRARA